MDSLLVPSLLALADRYNKKLKYVFLFLNNHLCIVILCQFHLMQARTPTAPWCLSTWCASSRRRSGNRIDFLDISVILSHAWHDVSLLLARSLLVLAEYALNIYLFNPFILLHGFLTYFSKASSGSSSWRTPWSSWRWTSWPFWWGKQLSALYIMRPYLD